MAAPDVFSPVELGPVRLRNRVVKAATFEGRTPRGLATDELIDFHAAVARGGTAMTTVAYLAVAPEGRTHAEQIWLREEALEGLRRLTDAVHGAGGAVAAQVGHAGPVANGRSNGVHALSPTAMPSPLSMQMIRRADEKDLARITRDYVRGARIAVRAGFDALELHLGHGYLLSSSSARSPTAARDARGGSLASRASYPREVVRAVRDEVGDEVAVYAKLGMTDGVRGGLSVEEALDVASMLESDGCLDALQLTAGSSLLNPMYLFRGGVPLRELTAQMPRPVRWGMRTVGRGFLKEYPYEEASCSARATLPRARRPPADAARRHQHPGLARPRHGRGLRVRRDGARPAAPARPGQPDADRGPDRQLVHPLQPLHAHHLHRHALRARRPRAAAARHPTRTARSTRMILDRFRLDGQVAVVTGAGRGIGAGTALALAECGADVLISSRTEGQLKDVAAQIEALGRRAVVVPADLSDLDAVASLATRAAEELGRLDIVVNNVGGTIPNAFLDTTPDYLEEAFRFNVSTAHALTRAAVPLMLADADLAERQRRRRRQHLLGDGPAGRPRLPRLRHGQGGARALDAAGRARPRPAHPGQRHRGRVGDDLRAGVRRRRPRATKEAMEAATPLRRIGEVEDIAATVVFLASQAGGYLTGKVVEVDGGLSQPNLSLGLADLAVPDEGGAA